MNGGKVNVVQPLWAKLRQWFSKWWAQWICLLIGMAGPALVLLASAQWSWILTALATLYAGFHILGIALRSFDPFAVKFMHSAGAWGLKLLAMMHAIAALIVSTEAFTDDPRIAAQEIKYPVVLLVWLWFVVPTVYLAGDARDRWYENDPLECPRS